MADDDEFWAMPDEETVSKANGLAGAIAASMAKWARKPADLYPTPKDCVYSVIPHVESLMPRGMTILEPACADGQISQALRECGYETVDYDLRPEVAWGIGGVDFLDRENGVFEDDSYDIVFTNPPFVVAEEFVERGLEIAPVVILLLKAQYFHVKKRIKLWRKATPEWEFKLTWRPAFLEAERGKSPLMDCTWFVFTRDWDQPFAKTMPIERLMEPPVDYGGL